MQLEKKICAQQLLQHIHASDMIQGSRFEKTEASKWSFWQLHFGASGSSILELLEAPFLSFQKLHFQAQKFKNSEAPKQSCQPQNEASQFRASQSELLGSLGLRRCPPGLRMTFGPLGSVAINGEEPERIGRRPTATRQSASRSRWDA